MLENNWRKSQKQHQKGQQAGAHNVHSCKYCKYDVKPNSVHSFHWPSEKETFFQFTCCHYGTVSCYSGPSTTFKFPWWSVPLDALWGYSVCEYNSPTPSITSSTQERGEPEVPDLGNFIAKTLGWHSISHKHDEMEAQTTNSLSRFSWLTWGFR